MYSPKISEELIPDLYRIAKAKKVPMTRLINDIIWGAIKDIVVETRIITKTMKVKEKIFVIKEGK